MRGSSIINVIIDAQLACATQHLAHDAWTRKSIEETIVATLLDLDQKLFKFSPVLGAQFL